LADSTSEIKHSSERPGDVKHSVAAIDKIAQNGFTPDCNFQQGLLTTINFLRQND
jgi:hypothetical protein